MPCRSTVPGAIRHCGGFLLVFGVMAGCQRVPPGSGGDVTREPWPPETASGGAEEGSRTAVSTGGVDESGDPDEGGGADFIMEPDNGRGPECDLWEDDCAEGFKCTPVANDGGGVWNDWACRPIEGDGQAGDDCVAREGGVAGIDTCAKGHMCWDVDPETDEGYCIAHCSGSEVEPTCPEGSTCVIGGDSVLLPCIPSCDPLAQDCRPGDACYPINGDFTCAPPAPEPGDGLQGAPCEFINACAPGFMCASAAGVPDCMGGGCCTAFCDRRQDFDTCPSPLECVPLYEVGMAPEGRGHYGACLVPQ